MVDKKASKAPKIDTRFASVAALILVLAVASAYYTYQTFIVAVNRAQLSERSELVAQQRASDIRNYLTGKQKQLNLFSARSSMVSAAQSQSAAAINTIVGSLKSAYPEATSARLFGLDRRELIGDTDHAPLSFIEQDMINRAEQRKAVSPEAIRTDSGWQLSLIAPIAENSEASVVGTLLIALPAGPLFQQIGSKDPELGQTRIMRKAAGKPVLVYQAGEGDAGPTVSTEIAGSDWLVQFTPSAQLASQVEKSPWLLLGLHLLAAVVLLLIARSLMRKPAVKKSAAATPDTQATTTPQPDDILDIQIASEDADILQLDEEELPAEPTSAEMEVTTLIELPDNVFRAYDIRGKAGSEITTDFAQLLGQAIASEALAAGETTLFVARDGRIHSPELCDALIEGIASTGCNVIYLGAVPTPLLYFATCEVEGSNSGVMVTASHNQASYNGFKMVLQGKTLVAEDVLRVKQRMLGNNLFQGSGGVTEQQIIPQYIDRIFSDVALAGSVKLVVDAGNGITGEVAPMLFEELGCEVVPLHCEIDGTFPNHDPDPTIVDNLVDLIAAVKDSGADLGVALDGDGDRLVVVTPGGNIIWPDRLLMLFAKDIVSGNPGADVLFDVKSTRELNGLISSYGGRPIMWKTGHSNMKTKMQETGALVGGEMSGHIFIKDRWYGFDDGMYATARLLEIMTLRDQDIDSLFASFPSPPSTPEIKIDVSEERKFVIIEQLKNQVAFEGGTVNDLDGLRVEFAQGWGLVRASNTSPALTLRFEAESNEELKRIQALFKAELLKVDPALSVPF